MNVQSTSPVRVERHDIHMMVREALLRNGVAPMVATLLADTIVAAEADGSRSHGLQRLPGYIGSLRSGWVDGAAEPIVHDPAPALVAVDARNGFAQMALAEGRALLQQKARNCGMAALAIRDSHHFAALWPDVEPFGREGFLALAMLSSRSRMIAWGGKKKILGTNPIAFACPCADRPPLVFDQASSVISQGDLLIKAAAGESVPLGVGVDAAGEPTTDPQAILNGGALLPYANAKGASIAFMVEILAAALSGAQLGFEDQSAAYPGAQTSRAGEFLLLIDPARINGNRFAERVAALITHMRIAGTTRMPGDKRYAQREKSAREGLPVDPVHYRYLRELLG